MRFRWFGAVIVIQAVPEIFKKSFLQLFMRVSAIQVTKMYKTGGKPKVKWINKKFKEI